ncbi:MAG: nodulation protein NfeD [Bryobacterales bacterium]|nr:nodulation protein NfeD [Bryobacterales bacterium]
MRTWIGVLALLGAGAASAASTVIAVNIDGVVHPITVDIVGHALKQVEEQHAAALLMRLNTPGGMLDATREIVEKMVASPVPVITYVTPSGGRAASAGFFLLEAGDVAAMAPGTNTGAASPVLIGQQMDPVMRRKVESDSAAWLRSITSRRGRNTELAEKTVLEAKSFTDREALDNHLIDLTADSEQELLAKLDGREVTRLDGRKQTLHLAAPRVVDYRETPRERIISAIADPNIAFAMLVIGGLAIYLEFTHPGLILPGVAGAIMVLMGLSALSVLPINWLGVALLVLSIGLFVLEAKFASHGILGAGGVVSMVIGALMLVEGPPDMRIHLLTAVAVALPFGVITVFLLSLVLKARRAKALTGTSGMVGETGTALTALNPSGKVFAHGEYWDAISSKPLEKGARVRVTAVEGLSVHVEPIP